jgi:FkbM family methyltransferase
MIQLLDSKSQNNQDNFVLSELGHKKNGFYVEFGACDGIMLSNSFSLENEYGWSGILAEPARSFKEALIKNRPNSKLDFSCVWIESNKIITFNEAVNGELSTINEFSEHDYEYNAPLKGKRDSGRRYEVETISLMDLLKKHNAPKEIDYLSIDTEGSEFDILNNFDFDEYDIKVITCEHNWTPNRSKIFDLLLSKGFERKYENYSKWDDWYVKSAKSKVLIYSIK